MDKGNCKHGEFSLAEGCKECIEERRVGKLAREAEDSHAIPSDLNVLPMDADGQMLVKVRYYSEIVGELSQREYTYYSEDRLNVGDVVMVPVRDTTAKAKVSAIDVPEAEIASFKDKVKMIPAGSRFVGKMIPAETDVVTVLTDVVTVLEEAKEEQRSIDQPVAADELEQATPMADVATVKISPGKDQIVVGLLDQVMGVKEAADKMVIATDDNAKGATNDLTIMKELTIKIDAKRKEYVGPLNEYVNSVNAAFKLLSIPLGEADKVVRSKMTAFKLGQQRRQREAEEVNRQAMEVARKQAELNNGEFTVETKPVPVVEAPKLTRTNLGSSGLVDNWKYEVTDLALLPREYMMPNDAMLKSIATKNHDKSPVPGVRFYNEPGLRVSKR